MGDWYDWVKIGARFIFWWDQTGDDGEVITKHLAPDESDKFADMIDRHAREIQDFFHSKRFRS